MAPLLGGPGRRVWAGQSVGGEADRPFLFLKPRHLSGPLSALIPSSRSPAQSCRWRGPLTHVLKSDGFSWRRGHQSPFTAWLAGPPESGSQSSDAGTLVGERGGRTGQAWEALPVSSNARRLEREQARQTARRRLGEMKGSLALSGPAVPRLLLAREPLTAFHQRRPRESFSAPSHSGIIKD